MAQAYRGLAFSSLNPGRLATAIKRLNPMKHGRDRHDLNAANS